MKILAMQKIQNYRNIFALEIDNNRYKIFRDQLEQHIFEV